MKNLLILLALFTVQAHANELKDHYLVCNNSDLRGSGYYPPVVSTLVISPEVNGKRYYTSWVGSQTKKNLLFTGRGPEELVNFSLTKDKLIVVFPEAKDHLNARYLYIKANRTDESFVAFRAEGEKETAILYPVKKLLGKVVVKEFAHNAQVECHFKSPDDILHTSKIDDVKVDKNFVQHYRFSEHVGVNARNVQEGLLADFVEKMLRR